MAINYSCVSRVSVVAYCKCVPRGRGETAKEWCAQVVAVGDRTRAAPGHGARHGHEPARAAAPRALARRRATAGRQPAAARLTRAAPTQGTHIYNILYPLLIKGLSI